MKTFREYLIESKGVNSFDSRIDNSIKAINESSSETIDIVSGIDKFDIGFLCNISLSDRYNSNSIIVPALIINKHNIGEDDWPVYDVYFWTKTNTGEYSGAILLKEICIWRYLSDKAVDIELISAAKAGDLDDLVPYKKEEYSYSFIKNGKINFIADFQYVR